MCGKPIPDISVTALTLPQLRAQTQPWLSQRPASLTPDLLAGQQRALDAIAQAQQVHSPFGHVFAILPAGFETAPVFSFVAERQRWSHRDLHDWVYFVNPLNSSEPVCLHLPAGSANAVIERVYALLDTEPADREPLLKSIQDQFSWPPLTRYLQNIGHKTFDDLPGSELATVIVSQEHVQPWRYCSQVTEAELFGQIRMQTISGTVSSELHLIQPGALLKANGGTLVVEAEQLLRDVKFWHRLKHILKHGEFHWPQPETAAFYSPQPVPIRVKVILAGSRSLLAQLRELDADFANLFPYLADFTDHYPTREIVQGGQLIEKPVEPYFNFLAYLQQRCGHRPLSDDGYDQLLLISSSYTEHQNELSLDPIRLIQLLEEADVIARQDKSTHIHARHLHQADQQSQNRELYMAHMSRQAILDAQIKIDTDNEVTGQVNGLTVVTTGGSEFGETVRITATVHYGDGDIIDIERKSELSGNIHTKGVMILMAYLANLFASKDPMPLSATLVFEQSYFEVDGDSASLAELCALISALADAPVNQALAVTGAIDQFGNVQAIGGVNQKIEGFYQLCRARGFAPGQGVIIPRSNQQNLHLNQSICDSVANGEFYIYAVDHVNDAFRYLLGDETAVFERIRQRIRDAHEEDHRPAPKWAWWK